MPVSKYWFLFIQSRLEAGPFKPCYAAYRSAFKRSGLKVPAGQLAHILRHTFASHFVMKGVNLVASSEDAHAFDLKCYDAIFASFT